MFTEQLISYTITSTDNAGNSVTTACSPALNVDTNGPIAVATASMLWDEVSPHDNTSVNSNWTASTSGDLSYEEVYYYDDAACTAPENNMYNAAVTSTHNYTAGVDGTTYYYRIRSYDNAGNFTDSACSPNEMLIDTTAPDPVDSSLWAGGITIINATGLTAQWTDGTPSTDLKEYKVEFYDQAACGGTVASTVTVAAPGLTTPFTGTNTVTHSFRVTTVDNADNEGTPVCSGDVLVDTTSPVAANTLQWNGGIIATNTLPLTAEWVASTSTDIATQRINYYETASCGGGVVETAVTASVNDTSRDMTYVVTSGNSYSFEIVTTDNAANVTTSACSPGIVIDNVAPVDPARMEWTQSPGPTNATTIIADWDVSTSSDLADQEIQFFQDGTCTATIGGVIPLTVSDTNSNLTGLTNNTTYTYRINSFDGSGNSNWSACSNAVTFDNVAPPKVTNPTWTQGAYATSVSLDANWTATNENTNGTDSQEILIYENNACSGAVHAQATLAGPATATYNYSSGTNGNTYYFKVQTTDAAGNVDTTANCSAGVTIDLTNPADPSTLAWNGGANPTNGLTVTASWANGGEGDIANQTIQFYDSATCTGGSENGAPIVIGGSATTTQNFTRAAGPSRTSQSFDVFITDNAGRTSSTICVSTPMIIDDEDPTAAVLTGWDEAPLTNSANVTARWTVSVSTDVVSQQVNYFTLAGCGGGAAGNSAIGNNTATTDVFTGGTGSTYYFNVTSTDDAGNSTTSACVAGGVTIDLDSPSNATGLGWVQTTPTNVTAIEADWTMSGDGDLNDQQITYYANGTCSAPILAGPTAVGTGTDNNQSQTGSHGTAYSYTITSVDNAGNTSTSGCSSALTVDTTGPVAVAGPSMLWDEVSPHDSTSVNSNWTSSVSPDLAYEEVHYFDDALCSLPVVANFNAALTSTHNFTSGTTGNTYYYLVKSFDTAGNSTDSVCSPNGMELDTTVPSSVDSALWAGGITITNATGLTAQWTHGAPDADLKEYKIEFYDAAACGGAVASTVTIAAPGLSSLFTGTDSVTHSFRVTTVDNADNEGVPVCSGDVLVDTTFPVAANTLVWNGGITSTNTLPLTAQWVASTSTDVATQRINYYETASCAGPVVETALTALVNDTSRNMTYGITSGNDYSFEIVSTDNAGNVTTSACSQSINIDNIPPVDPVRMEWTVSPGPTNNTTLIADWDVSTSADLNDQEIQFYTGSCTSTFGAVVSLTGTDTNSNLNGLVNGTTYSYQINSFDTSGNSNWSACSDTIIFDNLAPTKVTNPTWAEGTYSTVASINANWTATNENLHGTDSQQILIYENDASCSGAAFATATLGPAVATYNFTTGTDTNSYSFKVQTTDAAGNVDTTATCSSQLTIDLADPADPTVLAWNGGANPTNGLNVTASWTNGGEADIKEQTIQFYTGAGCVGGNEDGAAIVIPGSVINTQAYSRAAGPLRSVHSFDVMIEDNAGRQSGTVCVSTPMTIDDEDPNAAVLAGWDEAPLSNSANVTARWAVSTSTDVTAQTIEVYGLAACAGAVLNTTNIANNTSVTAPFTGGTGNTYYYRHTATDDAGNSTTSACFGTGVTIDLDDPADATNLGWVQTNPTNVTAIEADWDKSVAVDLADQQITYYANGTCANPILAGPTALGTVVDNNQSLTGNHGTVYSYTITSIDNAGNSSVSSCSSSLEVDTVAPTAAATGNLLWDEVSPHNVLSVNSNWTQSPSPDVSYEEVYYYDDSSCTAPEENFYNAALTTTHNFTAGANGTTYYYSVRSYDSAGNSTMSACSPGGMLLDVTAPDPVDAAQWAGAITASNTTGLTAEWTDATPSADLKEYKVEFFNASSCIGGAASTQIISAGTTNTSFTGTNSITHSFRVTTVDNADNEGTAVCSGDVLVDTTPPVLATNLQWNGGITNTNTLPLTAQWTASTSPDVTDQTINFYESASCGGGAVETVSTPALGTTDTSINMTYGVTAGNSYSFTISSTDVAGNTVTTGCSPGILIDNAPPVDPTNMVWTQSPGPTNAATIVADWTPSNSADFDDQEIQFYTGTCTATTGPVIPLTSADTNANLTGLTTNTTYSYRINSFDTSGNSNWSACSNTLVFDSTDPPKVTDPTWAEGAFSTTVSINANWTATNQNTNGTDTQVIKIYENNSCSGAVHAQATLAGPATATYNYSSGTDGNTYYFLVETIDAAGNVDTTATCSSGIKIDLTAPVAPTSLAWNGGANPTNNLTVTASWANGGEADIQDQTIQFYTGGGCAPGNEDGAAIVLGGSATTTQNLVRAAGPSRTTHSFDVTIQDTAGRTSSTVCVSSAMTIDDQAPFAANTLSWDQAPLTNTSNVTARWVASASGDVASQTLTYYGVAGCGGASVGSVVISNNTATTDVFTGGSGNTYSFTVTSTDDAGNATTTGCVGTSVTIDTDSPLNGTNLGWVQSDPTNVTAIEADWDKSVSGDINDQQITYYANGNCTNPILAGPTSVGIGTDNNQSLTAAHGTVYSYKITTIDSATNSVTSGCSSSLEVDTVAPTAALTGSLLWDEASPHNALSVNSNWAPSISGDLDYEEVYYYDDAACTAPDNNNYNAALTSTHNYTAGANGTTYYYAVRSYDTAGNSTLSACSPTGMLLDTTGPDPVDAAQWSGAATISNATGVTAEWTDATPVADLKEYKVEFYNAGSCGGAVASTQTVAAGTLNTAFTGTNSVTHSFKVTTVDLANNEGTSVCSGDILIDTTPPVAANTLQWNGGISATNTLPLTAQWVASTSTDVATQTINYYESASCGGAAVETAPTALVNDTSRDMTFGVTSGNSYTFTITSTDNAGNATVSSCSAAYIHQIYMSHFQSSVITCYVSSCCSFAFL